MKFTPLKYSPKVHLENHPVILIDSIYVIKEREVVKPDFNHFHVRDLLIQKHEIYTFLRHANIHQRYLDLQMLLYLININRLK